MQEELNQFEKNDVWELVPCPPSQTIIGTKWVFRNKQRARLLVQIYVGDIIFGATNESLCKKFSKLMQGDFEMSMMGELNFFLGLQIKQCQEGIYISQSIYTKELSKKFGIEEGRTVSTPMATNVKIDKDEKVCLCARFQSNPKESHMSAVKRIFRYLKGTIQYGLFYPKNENFSLKVYSDSDYAGNIDDRKSTTGSCQFLGDCLVSWFSKKQNRVSLSTAEVEYISGAFCCTQLLWMKQTLADYKCSYHVEKKDITLEYISTDKQLADILTKPLCELRFEELKHELGLIEPS
ncbi:hypothetical protein DH2020_004846 [Rehmannia glutinosa]|uniref:Reverse transcriptase Ty1/copia-type domain-containing protein n=1 Tax=Rehmannia glutinosa TaxID=99300 RepID=A0ABR0XQZ3_REHGL